MATTTKPKVLVTRSDIPSEALKKLSDRCEIDMFTESYPIPQNVLLQRIKGKDALLCLLTDKIGKDVLDAAGESLKVIATMSVGYDHLSLPDIQARGIKVGNTPGVSTDAVAELTVALLLATSRRILDSNKALMNGEWEKCDWSPLWMMGWGLSGSTVGVYGLGCIGQEVLRRLQGYKIKEFLYAGLCAIKEGDDLNAKFVSFEDLLEQSDFLIINAVLCEATKGIFNKEAFSKMKNTAILINTSRGGLIDQDALVEALKTGKIRAAGLDVMSPEPLPLGHPLTKTPNLTLLPHIGSAEKTVRDDMAMLTVDNILAVLDGSLMPASVC